jgi:hypothetical protein
VLQLTTGPDQTVTLVPDTNLRTLPDIEALIDFADTHARPIVVLDTNRRPWILTIPDDPVEDYDAWSHETNRDDGVRAAGDLIGPFILIWHA